MNRENGNNAILPLDKGSVVVRTDGEHGIIDEANNDLFGGDAVKGYSVLRSLFLLLYHRSNGFNRGNRNWTIKQICKKHG